MGFKSWSLLPAFLSAALLSLLLFSCDSDSDTIIDPLAANNGIYPTSSEYSGPFFKANYDYPTQVPASDDYPWESILNGQPLTLSNAEAYIMAVRDYIYEDMAVMINEPESWQNSPNRQNWFNMAWSAQEYSQTEWEGLETIYGTMTGQVLKDSIFADYGFVGPLQNHALVYYNDLAAYTLYNLWKSNDPSGFYPEYTTAAAQFEQNAIIIKAAGSTATGEQWDVLDGAGTLQIYREMEFGPDKGKGPVVQELAWIQFDIIIKDTIAAPETGWVFSTFIYNAASSGATTFDRLEVLGVTWGSNPEVIRAGDPLNETWLNPNRPAYAEANIGWGNRLSGPIDVAMVGGTDADGKAHNVYVLNKDGSALGGESYSMFRTSSCLSCHGTASWPWQNDFYPSPVRKLVYSDTLYNPQGEGWREYYQNRPGTEIMPAQPGNKSPSIMALDYDLFMQFALNNSLLGKHYHSPIKPAVPAGYTPLELDEFPYHLKPVSK